MRRLRIYWEARRWGYPHRVAWAWARWASSWKVER